MTLIKVPSVIKRIYPNLTWDNPTGRKNLYLTFDDGPIPEVTPWVLTQLKAYGAKATFFCVGENIKKHPLLYNELRKQGHAVGNHTHNHLNGWKTKTESYIENIEEAKKYVSSSLFRPPYGKIRRKQAKILIERGYKIIMWDVLSEDYNEAIPSEKVFQNVIKNSNEGSIIVFHDSLKSKKNLQEVLPRILEYYAKKGYSFKRIVE